MEQELIGTRNNPKIYLIFFLNLLNFSAKTTDFSPWMKQESNLVDKIPWALARGSLFFQAIIVIVDVCRGGGNFVT